jgi:hypothetical protein
MIEYIIHVDISSLDICDKNQKKRDDARSILMINLDWFRLSHRVIALYLVFIVLRYEI